MSVLAVALPAGLVSGAGAYPEASLWSPVGTGVPIDTKFQIGWTMAMETASVEDAFSLTDGIQVFPGPLMFAWTHGTSPQNFSEATPLFTLNSSTTYRATVLSIATDASGLYPLDQDGDGVGGEATDVLTWNFTTEDGFPPKVVIALPGDGAVNVPETTDVVLQFSESMDPASVEDAFSLASAPRTWTKLDGTFTWSPGQDEATYTPSANLAFGTAYMILLAAGATDTNGNPLDGNGDGTAGDEFVSEFATRAEPDAVPPSVTSTMPADGATRVTRMPWISISFDDAMKQGETAGAISMEQIVGAFAALLPLDAFEWSAANHTVSFTPAQALDWDSLYRVYVSKGARDDAGLQLPVPHAFTFRTEKWNGHVIGVVVIGGAPVPGATVTLDNSTTQTNETGAFAFDGVEAGTYEVTIAKDGYVTVLLTRELTQWAASGEGGRVIDLGTISLHRSDLLSPVAAASIVAAVLAALAVVGLLLRRRRSVVRFDELEPDDGEAER